MSEQVKEQVKEKKLFVKRKEFGKSKEGNPVYSYILPATVRGRNVEINFTPQDIGGYEVLSIVYDSLDTAELRVIPYEMTDEKGNVITGNMYEVFNIDENGVEYACKVKLRQSSDKNLMEMVLRSR